jgi:HEAT repeat protein
MVRSDLPQQPLVEPAITPPPLPGGLEARLSDPDREQRRVAIFEVLDRLDAGVPLETIAPGRREQLLVMRNLAEIGSGRGLWPAWQTFRSASWRVQNEAGGALNFIALNYQLGRYLWAPDAAARVERPPPHLDQVDAGYLQTVLLQRSLRMRLGVFAAWALTQRRDADAAAGFRALEGEKDQPYFRLAGGEGLHAIGDPSALPTLVGLLALREHATQNLIPSYLLGLAPDERAAVGGALVAGLGAEEPLEREVSAWLAGDGGFAEAMPALRTARTDPAPEVRDAAAWALERLERKGTQ